VVFDSDGALTVSLDGTVFLQVENLPRAMPKMFRHSPPTRLAVPLFELPLPLRPQELSSAGGRGDGELVNVLPSGTSEVETTVPEPVLVTEREDADRSPNTCIMSVHHLLVHIER
jgi:hypothetical protein